MRVTPHVAGLCICCRPTSRREPFPGPSSLPMAEQDGGQHMIRLRDMQGFVFCKYFVTFCQKRDQWDCLQLQPVPHDPVSRQHVHHHAAHPVVPATGILYYKSVFVYNHLWWCRFCANGFDLWNNAKYNQTKKQDHHESEGTKIQGNCNPNWRQSFALWRSF